jgi:hypothetical protein
VSVENDNVSKDLYRFKTHCNAEDVTLMNGNPQKCEYVRITHALFKINNSIISHAQKEVYTASW